MPSEIGSFFTRLRQTRFKRRIDTEIFGRIFSHQDGEKNHGYPFTTREEMNALAAQFDPQALLDRIEQHIRNMPDAYGESFRYIMHRDIHARLLMYEQLAQRRIRHPSDPRYIPLRLEPAQ